MSGGLCCLAGEGTEPAADTEENGTAYAWQHAGFAGEEDAGHVQEWPAWDGSAQVSRLSPAVRVSLLAGSTESPKAGSAVGPQTQVGGLAPVVLTRV